MATYRVTFLKRDTRWIGWTEDVPVAVVQGKTLDETRKRLKDAITRLDHAADRETLPETGIEIVHEDLEV